MAIPSWHFYLKHTLFNAVALAERSYGINLSQSLHDSKPNVLYVCVHATNVTFRSLPAIRHLNDYWHKIKDGYIKKERKNPLWIITAATSSPSCTNHFQFAGHGADGVTVGLVFSVYSLDMLQVHNILCSRDNAQLIETVLNSHYSQVKKKKLF